MVERPIKKSERPAENSSEAPSQTSDSKPSAPSKPQRSSGSSSSSERSDDRPSGRSNDRSSGRGKRGSQDDEPRQMTNPALMRGPKPVKAPIAPEPQPDAGAEEETTADAIAETSDA